MFIVFLGELLAALDNEIIALTNQYREENNMDALVESKILRKVAESQANYMCRIQRLTHTSPEGSLEQRLKEVDFNSVRAGENIAKSQSDNPVGVVTQWKKHRPHNKNILGDYSYTGVGTCKDENGYRYWVQVYGKDISNKMLPNAKDISKLEDYIRKGYTGFENDRYVILFKAQKKSKKKRRDKWRDSKSESVSRVSDNKIESISRVSDSSTVASYSDRTPTTSIKSANPSSSMPASSYSSMPVSSYSSMPVSSYSSMPASSSFSVPVSSSFSVPASSSFSVPASSHSTPPSSYPSTVFSFTSSSQHFSHAKSDSVRTITITSTVTIPYSMSMSSTQQYSSSVKDTKHDFASRGKNEITDGVHKTVSDPAYRNREKQSAENQEHDSGKDSKGSKDGISRDTENRSDFNAVNLIPILRNILREYPRLYQGNNYNKDYEEESIDVATSLSYGE